MFFGLGAAIVCSASRRRRPIQRRRHSRCYLISEAPASATYTPCATSDDPLVADEPVRPRADTAGGSRSSPLIAH